MENPLVQPILQAFADALHHSYDPSSVHNHTVPTHDQHPVASLIDDLVDAGKQVSYPYAK